MFAFASALTAFVRRSPQQQPVRHSAAPCSFVGRALLAAAVVAAPLTAARSDSVAAMSLADLTDLTDIDGKRVPPDTFSGKVVFVMNVASACGYTRSGYALFARLTAKYAPEHFVAVAIPCNAFGMQESGSPADIKAFAHARAASLLVMQRSDVNGPNQHPIVQLAKSNFPRSVSWNFDGRYVFDRNGRPIARFGNSASDAQIEAAIDAALSPLR